MALHPAVRAVLPSLCGIPTSPKYALVRTIQGRDAD